MSAQTHLAQIGALLGDPARANILLALMDGRARTAKELAFLARVSAPTASAHLGKLADGGLLAVVAQGRHRYYRIASVETGHMLETMLGFAGGRMRTARRAGPADLRLRTARTCYDHIAGRLGVAIAQHLQKAGHVVLDDGAGQISASGHAFFAKLGLDVSQGGSRGHRALCRPCLDWSERRYHIGGTLGRALCEHCLSEAWIERERDTRALIITEAGREAFDSLFGWASMDEEEGACREETAFEAGAFP
ncbi:MULTISPECIES: winged helix-turn-helix domain-containing protein [unclassified Chelatococcus]|uniref:ArsR/SmtB family transcription factor n=1 Tax=unclassified Chelatococcus TaxID=2638111 RepID=UPI001BCFD85E|nr:MULTISPECIES: winged helix-turn-helix domain-containing protein [unclassified Chelatococcus]MBS7698126.1 winged helix-turn-helix transcriptional regulator [Chelatococcus sp. YT9]MBX3556556.1 winged helix-turn-helix transcriptional regulator [Chelatococcus sp.]